MGNCLKYQKYGWSCQKAIIAIPLKKNVISFLNQTYTPKYFGILDVIDPLSDDDVLEILFCGNISWLRTYFLTHNQRNMTPMWLYIVYIFYGQT